MPHERGIVQLFLLPHLAKSSKASLSELESQLQFSRHFRECWGCYGSPDAPDGAAEDCFALGCVIAEIYRLGGPALFTSQEELQNYLSGDDSKEWELELRMLPSDLAELVCEMRTNGR